MVVHEYTVKTHEFGGVYFRLKRGHRPRDLQNPTKRSRVLSAEGCHRAARLQQEQANASLS